MICGCMEACQRGQLCNSSVTYAEIQSHAKWLGITSPDCGLHLTLLYEVIQRHIWLDGKLSTVIKVAKIRYNMRRELNELSGQV